jgi:nitrite reductase (NO-forming)
MVTTNRVSRRNFLDKVLIATGVGASGAIFGAAFSVLDNKDANPGGEAASSEFAPGPTINGAVAEAVPAALEPADTAPIKQLTLDAIDATLEIAGGVEYNAWTFGERVPGPVVHVRQGDLVQFTLNNKATSGGHSIDFHAAQIPWDTNYKTILPGESLSFDWEAHHPGVFMYHCGTAPVLHHISNGMYGAIVVDPETPLQPAREYVLVQSELYASSETGGNPWSGDMEKMKANRPDLMAFNGKAFQYRDHPLPATAGELIRLYVVNAGPTQFSAFHVIGALFDRVYVDGNPKNVLEGVQTWTVPPGGGSTFELVIPDAGLYPFVTHSFAYTELGAVGLLEVT